MPGEFAVELINVAKQFDQVVAVDDVSLQIRDGEFFSLLGPSGCGKTTTLRMIGGFEMPTAGDVLIGGEIQGFKPPFQRPVNTVFQSYALFPHMTIFDNVAFGLQMKKVAKNEIKERVNEMLELVQLPGVGHRKPDQLSGGQQQRIALARALINKPKVLLLDEPLGALDLKLRKAMQLELKALQQRVGITFIYVTHDQEEALTMSDRIAVMNEGKVWQLDNPEEIYEHPANRFVADFIGETNFMEGKVSRLTDERVFVAVDEQVPVPLLPTRDVQVGQAVTVAVRPEKLSVSAEKKREVDIPGTVDEVIYIGTDIRYIVRITDGTTLAVREQNRGGLSAQRFSAGDHIHIGWYARNASLLTE
ncbi:MAG: ABC transporter ATP-binding protein [Chloroflexi bacterium]|nr:ABC transporter ATP-binding protein [Chloroflexota bacterium]